MTQKSTKYSGVVLFLLIIASVAIAIIFPAYSRYRQTHSTDGWNDCCDNLRWIYAGKAQWALEHHKTTNDVVTWDDLRPYFPNWSNSRRWSNGLPVCHKGGEYTIGKIGQLPECSIGKSEPGHAHSIQWWRD
jgi:hypothetical protein